MRAEAKRALGDIDGAERDYNKAWHTDDEEGIQERALAGLDSIDRPINEDGPNDPARSAARYIIQTGTLESDHDQFWPLRNVCKIKPFSHRHLLEKTHAWKTRAD